MLIINTAFSTLILLDESFPSARYKGISVSEAILSRFLNLGTI